MPARLRVQTKRDDGVAMLEFAFVGVLLVMLAFGIIIFGLLLSFKQDVTRAAAEGARAGAVTRPPTSAPSSATADARHQRTVAATDEAVEGFDQDCDDPAGGMTCSVTIHDCEPDPGTGLPVLFPDYWNNNRDDCVTVELLYDYANNPLVVDPPLISAALPNKISSKSVARLNQ